MVSKEQFMTFKEIKRSSNSLTTKEIIEKALVGQVFLDEEDILDIKKNYARYRTEWPSYDDDDDESEDLDAEERYNQAFLIEE